MVRIKHRYLLVHILYPEKETKAKAESGTGHNPLPDIVQFHRPSPDYLEPQHLIHAIKDQVLLLYGDYGVGLVSNGLNVKYLSPVTSTAIIRCSRAHYRLVWAALSFMTQLPESSKHGTPRLCVMQVVRVSGTIKKAEEEVIKKAKAAILRAKRESGEGGTDGLMGLLGYGHLDEDASNMKAQNRGKMTAGSIVSDEDEMEMDSDDGD